MLFLRGGGGGGGRRRTPPLARPRARRPGGVGGEGGGALGDATPAGWPRDPVVVLVRASLWTIGSCCATKLLFLLWALGSFWMPAPGTDLDGATLSWPAGCCCRSSAQRMARRTRVMSTAPALGGGGPRSAATEPYSSSDSRSDVRFLSAWADSPCGRLVFGSYGSVVCEACCGWCWCRGAGSAPSPLLSLNLCFTLPLWVLVPWEGFNF